MNNQEKMLSAASGAMNDVFELASSDKILILTDTHCKSIAKAFDQSAIAKGCAVQSYEIIEGERPLKEIPEELEKLLPGKTIVLNIIKAYAEEIQFRIKWIFKVEESKRIRMGHMPGITEEMMLGSVNVDYDEMKADADSLITFLQDANKIHITTEAGTDLMLGVKGRMFIGDVGVRAGEMCNLPCGEIYCAPLETEANGVIVFDASIGDIGLLKNPLRVSLTKGRITNFESEDVELVNKIIALTNVDDDAKVIGELGIGINPSAVITGNMLEDEKAKGTAHIAFGNNEDFSGGGNNHSQIHRDYLFYHPTIEVTFTDETRKIIMKNGQFNF
jgi:aminopeptidase